MGDISGQPPNAADASSSRWVWFSSVDSFNAGKVSIFAMVEFLAAIALLAWLLADGRFVNLWLVGSLTAVLLLLRTPRSIANGARWLDRLDYWTDQIAFAPLKLTSGILQWLVLPMVLLIAPAYAIITLLIVPIRMIATAEAAVRHPLQTLREIPRNWYRQIFCIDSIAMPEVVPGFNELKRDGWTPLQFPLLRDDLIHGNWLERFFSLAIAVSVFGPMLVYRLSFKLTGMAWVPLLWVVDPLRPGSDTVREKLEDLRHGIVVKLALAWSVFVVAAFAAKLFYNAALSFLPPLLYQELVVTTYPWHIAAAVNGAVAIALFLFADRQLVQLSRDKALSPKVLQALITGTITFRRAVGVYTLANGLWLIAVVSGVFEKTHVIWKWFYWS